MKLLLLNLYDNKKRDAKLKLGINRFDNKKIIVLTMFAIMILSAVLIIPIMFANNSVLLYLVSAFFHKSLEMLINRRISV